MAAAECMEGCVNPPLSLREHDLDSKRSGAQRQHSTKIGGAASMLPFQTSAGQKRGHTDTEPRPDMKRRKTLANDIAPHMLKAADTSGVVSWSASGENLAACSIVPDNSNRLKNKRYLEWYTFARENPDQWIREDDVEWKVTAIRRRRKNPSRLNYEVRFECDGQNGDISQRHPLLTEDAI